MIREKTGLFGPALLLGFGPASIQLAVDLARNGCPRLGVLSRPGANTDQARQALQRQPLVSLLGQARCVVVAGQARIDDFYEDPGQLGDDWECLALCVPSHAYRQVLERLPWDRLRQLRSILLLSPGLGSGLLVSQLVLNSQSIEIVSLSNYYAATKYAAAGDPLTAITKALKRKVYVGAMRSESRLQDAVAIMLAKHGISAVQMDSCLEAESRNITNYVHPPLFLSDFALDVVLGDRDGIPKYMYKLYPAGPITTARIRSMLLLWKEQMQLLQRLGVAPFNLLKFLNDDNYPVPEEVLAREDIESFCELDELRQSYLLYVRYSALLVDPFSVPDQAGHYFDFSAVPFAKAEQGADGRWKVPRIPLEDYKKLKLVAELGRRLDLVMPEAMQLLGHFEAARERFEALHGKHNSHPDLWQDDTRADVAAIARAWELEA